MEKISIKLKKIDESNDTRYGVDIGYAIEGFTFFKPTVGERFVVFHDDTKMLRTSYVTEIISPNKFKTENSTYEWEDITVINNT